MIASDTRIVIVGDPGALERLRGELPSAGIELRPIEGFLAAFDRETSSGEGQLRRMEELYASLRGKLLVRLMLVNLNPEVVLKQGDRLQELAEAWKCIEGRLAELLQERRNEGIDFATVLVTEEGDWTQERREILHSFSQSAEGSMFRMRCYLMTRLLELGRDRVVHAKDAWPTFVAGLIRHFLWKDEHAGSHRAADRKRFFDVEGLYAWRTLQIVAGVPDSTVRGKTQEILSAVTRKFFGERPAALFPAPLSIEPENSGGVRFEPDVKNPFGRSAWNELGEKDFAELENPETWKIKTELHAATERNSSWQSRCSEKSQSTAEAGSRVKESQDVPGQLFPGGLPSPAVKGLPEVRSVLRGIQEKRDDVERRTLQLREWWDDHQRAACGFVVTGERLVVGLIVSMALSYGILSVQVVIQKYLPGSLFPIERGLMLAGLAVAGVVVMLLLGYLTQRWRGRNAREKLKKLGDEWIDANVGLRQRIADSLRGSRQTGAHIREAAARRQLVKRLHRIEQILSAELQPGSMQDDGGISSTHLDDQADEAQRHRKLLEVVVESAPQDGFSVTDLIEKTTRDFFRGWKSLLAQSGARVMIAAPAVLGLCRRSVSDLRQTVDSELRESAAARLSSEGPERIREQLQEVQFDGNERHFYSVDLRGGAPRDSVWYRRGFQSAFESSGFEHPTEIELSEGILAVLYGECPLRIVETNNQRRLDFLTEISKARSLNQP
ncbi:hypothetical protein HQ447_11805 [bacterium]|nr:hypothetical protein [bacterium]